MKKTGRILAIVLALTMLLSVSAFAAWDQYQGGISHNGQITNGTPPTSTPTTVRTVNLDGNDDAETIMVTEGTTVYAYSISSKSLKKVDCSDGSVEWTRAIASGGFNLATPAYGQFKVGENTYTGVFVAANGFYGMLANPQFTDDVVAWTTSGGASISAADHRAVLPQGASIEQTFKFSTSSGTHQTELYSQVMHQSETASGGVVLYELYDYNGETIGSWTVDVKQGADWTNVEEVLAVHLDQNENYKLKVTAQAGDLYVHHVEYQCMTSGISFVTTDNNIYNVEAAPYGGQINTPLVYYTAENGESYLYYGVYANATKDYYQVYLTGDSAGACRSYENLPGDNEYWAGVTVVDVAGDECVVFGDDKGYLHVTPVGESFGSYAVSPINLSALVGESVEQVRSSISTDGTDIYLTTKGNYLIRIGIADLASETITNFGWAQLSADREHSTSTPAISQNGFVYVGTYTGPNGTGSVKAIAAGFGEKATEDLITIYTGQGVQASPIVYSSDDGDYVYFTTNTMTGTGYCYLFDGEIATSVWPNGAGGSGFALQGFAFEGSYLVYGDDSAKLYILS